MDQSSSSIWRMQTRFFLLLPRIELIGVQLQNLWYPIQTQIPTKLAWSTSRCSIFPFVSFLINERVSGFISIEEELDQLL
jgi:hypothetical protein